MSYDTQSLLTTQKEQFTLNPVDSAGAAITLDGPVVFASDDPVIATAGVDFRGNYFINAFAAGTTNITITSSSAGVVLTEAFSVNVSPDAAVTFGLKFLAPIPR